jgi:signal transduction histidine kinase
MEDDRHIEDIHDSPAAKGKSQSMMQKRVNALLFVAILVLAVLPMAAAFYFVDKALETSLNLGFNSQIIAALDADSKNLKTLGRLDASRQSEYHEEFQKVENLKSVYDSPQIIKRGLHHALIIYFAIGVAAALLLSVWAAALLSRRISRSFRSAFDELAKHREKVRYLEEISSWQEFAKILAHEIKNPLTPIEVLVTSLLKSYRNQPTQVFEEQLAKTQVMISEELAHLNDTVDKFSDFAKLPAIRPVVTDLSTLLAQQLAAIGTAFPAAKISIDAVQSAGALQAKIDPTLFRRALTNIVRNGLDANTGSDVHFTVTATDTVGGLQIVIANNGVPIPKDLAMRIFDPYITSKAGKDNMGLGLAIVRKILLEHGGDIAHAEQSGHPAFVIILPRVA